MPRQPITFFVLGSLALALACEPPGTEPPGTELREPAHSGRGHAEDSKPAAEGAPAAAADAAPHAVDSKPADGAPSVSLPPVDDSCTQDAECVAGASLFINDRGSCCRGCLGEPENLRSSEARATACAALSGDTPRGGGCPTRRCAAPREVRCDAGHCVFSGA